MTKKLLLLFLLISLLLIYWNEEVKAQDVGISLGFGTSTALYGDFFYLDDNNSYHLGGTFQFSDALGDLIDEDEREPNHGRTVIGSGNYFWSIDFGYNYHFQNKIIVGGELSLGSRNEYTNYEDNRFSEGGYHMVEPDLTGGIGVNAGYEFSNTTFGFIGYNTLREITFGIRFAFQYQ